MFMATLRHPLVDAFFKKKKFILFLAVLGWVFTAEHLLYLVAAREGYSVVAVHGLLTAVMAGLVAEHRL